MAEESSKIKFDYENPENVEAEVPSSQNLREVDASVILDENTDGAVANVSNDIIEPGDFSLEPVITITKQEATFTKGDLKLQKIEEIKNGEKHRIIKRSYTESQSQMVQGSEVTTTTVKMTSSGDKDEDIKEVTTEERKSKTKIPKLKFRQTVEKVKAEQMKVKESEESESPKPKINRRSKVTTITSKPIVTKRNSALLDDEFEKIYEDLIDEHFNFDENLLGNKIDDADALEIKFEEMVHDYDENKIQPINVEEIRHSKIPFRRRRSEQGHIEKTTSELHTEKVTNEKAKNGSSIPLLRSKSERDAERTEGTMEIKEHTAKEKTKHSSSIPLPRRKSGQDGELSKTIYNKSEKDGIITKTVTTITKSAPVSQIKLEKGSISTASFEHNVTDKQLKEQKPINEDKSENKTSIDKSKIKKSIPRLIDSKHDGRKIIRSYTRTVTTEKVVSGKGNMVNNVITYENPEKNIELETSSSNTNNVELTTHEKETIKTKTLHSLQEENIVKDSVKVAIPSLDSKSDINEGNVQNVEVTKMLEWNTNVDKDASSSKFKTKLEVNESEMIKFDDSLSENCNALKSCNILQDGDETIISSERDMGNKDTNLKEREGSRFNQVSNLTILKGIDHEETLKSPRLLSSTNSEATTSSYPSTPVESNFEISSNIKETKVSEVMKSPKLDKDGNLDVLPEYNIRIKRYSREMKQMDDPLKQWQIDENVDIQDKTKTTQATTSTETTISSNKVEVSNMDSARNLLSRVLNREIKTETPKTNEEINKINDNATESKENDINLPLTNKQSTAKTLKESEIQFDERNIKVQQTSNDISNKENIYQIINTKRNEGTKESLNKDQEDIKELGIKGKIGKLINKIDSKEFSEDTRKKEEETPVRRSVLSKVAMFERQEPLDNIKSRKPRPELTIPKFSKPEEQRPSRVHVHTPTIVKEVLKTPDWDLNLNNENDNSEVTWKIDFDKIILNRNDTNIDSFYEKSNKDSMYQIQRTESILKDSNNIDIKSHESVPGDLNSTSIQEVDVPSKITNLKENIIKEKILSPVKTDFKVQISDDNNEVNLVNENSSKADIVEMRNKLKIEVKDVATSPKRLSFDVKDFENKIKNQVLADAPVIIVSPKLNDSMSKSTEAIFSTQPKMDSKIKVKKVDRTTSMTEKLYPEKVKANIALYESIKNDSYHELNKSDSKMNENSSTSIFETYKNERYAKANRIDVRAAYTPQNSVNSDYVSINEVSQMNTSYKYVSSISVDENKNKENNLTHKQKYGSLQFINETVDTEALNDETLKTEAIIGMNKAVYRLTFDDKNTSEFDNEATDNLQASEIVNDKKSKEFTSKQDIKEKTDFSLLEDIGIKPINEIVRDSYEIYTKSSNTNENLTRERKLGRYRSKYDDEDDETGGRMIKSLPIIESGDVKGKVRIMNRLRSVEQFEERRRSINIKEMPRKLSVLEKIALFEGLPGRDRFEQ